ncbi:MAG: NADH:flavin oxidoreductase [Candidatus Schekmanbacteria bacterium]|nr:MAG: NADH:flavin oxidoreductase [Candidatus Schekmanbacteria bacterium]
MSQLFSKCNIANLEVKNRFVRSATEEYIASEDGSVSQDKMSIFEKLAAGGSGLIILGHSFIDMQGRCHIRQKGIHDDRMIESFIRIKEKIKAVDSNINIAVQINHGGRQSDPSITSPIAPSAIRPRGMRVKPREMTKEEIKDVIRKFADAAVRAEEAGVDAVQIHSAHGYLLSQFLSPYTNRRNDEWGGDRKGRLRIVKEIIEKIKEKVSAGFPLFIKINIADFVEGGLTPEEGIENAIEIGEEGIAAIEPSCAIAETKTQLGAARPGIIKEEMEAYFSDFAKKIKKNSSAKVFLVGGVRSRKIMEKTIDDGIADLISMSRPLIREPDLPLKIYNGKEKADCISCNRCFHPEEGEVRCRVIENN